MQTIHPAHSLPFDTLLSGLEEASNQGMVYIKSDITRELSLYIYSPKCVYEKGWNDITVLARGLIVDQKRRRIVATPFPKFFNAEEQQQTIPNLPFETFEKLDGSLIIIYYHDGGWKTATKGSFTSSQAAWAQARLDKQDLSALVPGTTYLAEAVYPENRIVVLYTQPALVMLAAYSQEGRELNYAEIQGVCARLGWRSAERHSFNSLSELMAHTRTLPVTHEGFVIRFQDGYRLKLKGDEYRRVHALISRCTPLAMWESMVAGDDMQKIRRELPEEFWTDFDAIIGLLNAQIESLIKRIAEAAAAVAHLTDKEVGLGLASLPEDVRPFIFYYRKSGGRIEGRSRDTLMRMIRPTGNELPGYEASYAMNRVIDEAIS